MHISSKLTCIFFRFSMFLIRRMQKVYTLFFLKKVGIFKFLDAVGENVTLDAKSDRIPCVNHIYIHRNCIEE